MTSLGPLHTPEPDHVDDDPAPAPLPDVAVFPPTPDDIGDILEAIAVLRDGHLPKEPAAPAPAPTRGPKSQMMQI